MGHWKFDEESGATALDSGPLGLDGAVVGATREAGKLGGALHFNARSTGTPDHVDMGDVLNSLTWPITITAWVSAAAPGTTRVAVATDFDPSAYYGAWLGLSTRDDVYGGYGKGGAATYSQYSKGYLVTAGQWTHIAVTVLDAKTLTLYIDGVAIAGTPVALLTSGTMVQSAAPFIIGRQPGSASGAYVGLMDDVRIYSRALSVAEVGLLAAQ